MIISHYDGEKFVEHLEVHNIYGYSYHKVSYESLKARYDNKIRPFVLSRSFYAGSQQYGFVWTGDNKATWEFLENSIDTLQTLSMCGISACGADVGGFAENPSEELMMSWFEVGAFYPFFRGHSHCETIRREPWCFSEETLFSIKNSIVLRYHLLNYFYTKFYEHCLTGTPILKPLWLKFTDYYKTLSDKRGCEFMVGNEFIIMPYLQKNK